MLRLPPPIWALIYLIVAGIVSAFYPWGALVSLRVVWLGIVVTLAGLALAVSGAGLFWRKGTEINPTSDSNKQLVTSGPYNFTRNPMYLGLILFTLGIALCSGSLPMFAVPVLVFATTGLVHIPFEEAKMRRQFGPIYDEYTRRVRRWI